LIFKKDYFLFGLIIGALSPLFCFFGAKLLLNDYFNFSIKINTIYVCSILINFFLFRYYMINKEMDKTGRGILLSTFGYAFLYIYIYII